MDFFITFLVSEDMLNFAVLIAGLHPKILVNTARHRWHGRGYYYLVQKRCIKLALHKIWMFLMRIWEQIHDKMVGELTHGVIVPTLVQEILTII